MIKTLNTNEDKAAALAGLAEELHHLEASPLYAYRQENDYQFVLGEGNPGARLMFIGEAPGRKEAETGRPFVGAAGRILDELLQSIELDRADVYITNIVKDRPPDNRDPTPAELALYQPFLARQIEIIQPRLIATLGRFAMAFILEQFGLPEKGQKISALHGTVLSAQTSYGTISIVPLYHPAVALYARSRKGTLETDFQTLREMF